MTERSSTRLSAVELDATIGLQFHRCRKVMAGIQNDTDEHNTDISQFSALPGRTILAGHDQAAIDMQTAKGSLVNLLQRPWRQPQDMPIARDRHIRDSLRDGKVPVPAQMPRLSVHGDQGAGLHPLIEQSQFGLPRMT